MTLTAVAAGACVFEASWVSVVAILEFQCQLRDRYHNQGDSIHNVDLLLCLPPAFHPESWLSPYRISLMGSTLNPKVARSNPALFASGRDNFRWPFNPKAPFFCKSDHRSFQNRAKRTSRCISRGFAFGDVGVSGREQLCDFEVEKVNVEGEGYQGDDYKVLILWSQRRDSNPRPPVYENDGLPVVNVYAGSPCVPILSFCWRFRLICLWWVLYDVPRQG